VNRVLDEDGRTDYDRKSKLKKRDKGLVAASDREACAGRLVKRH